VRFERPVIRSARTARGEEKAKRARNLGVEPVEVDLYDTGAVRRAISGSDAVLRLTTKIPSVMKMGKRGAWTETNRLRTVGARILVDAALEERVPVYVNESVVFVYADGGAEWLDEDARIDDAGSPILRAALDGEREAARVTKAGGRGIVLRFGGFYGPDAPSTLETAQLARRRMFPQIGSGANYISSIYVPDAGRAVVAALSAPAGTYNICDNTPVPFADHLRAVVEALGTSRSWRLPAALAPILFGEVGKYVFRSLRVSNRRFREATDWAPAVTSVFEGWPRIAAEWRLPTPAATAGA